MPSTFLSAEWLNLLMINYTVDPRLLQPYLPCGTEPDSFNGEHYLSLVGLYFKNTRLLGMPIPGHRHFEEVNLRFYVRYKENYQWKRGVVFIREIVPRAMISFVANSVFGENYTTCPMRHSWEQREDRLYISYSWKTGSEWNYMKAVAEAQPVIIREGSGEAFITEHYWGFTSINDHCAGVYQVTHPQWKVHRVLEHEVKVNAGLLYGREFEAPLSAPPHSVFLADGSAIQVMQKTKLYFQPVTTFK